MSKISQELRALFYLNDKRDRSNWVKIKEIADYLETSERQARRYLEDLNLIPGIIVETRLGRNGGYHLEKGLDKGLAIPENLVLAMSIAMKRNEKIESVLATLPNYIATDAIVGDNAIDNAIYDNLEILIKAIEDQKEVIFNYRATGGKQYYCQPYKIYFTNRTYYLLCADKDGEYRNLDVAEMEDIKRLGSFKPDKKIEETVCKAISSYGLMRDGESTLRVKCKDEKALSTFDKYFEGKGIKNLEELTYTVSSHSENQLYYPLFRISTKCYKFLDEEFKNKYLFYLRAQIKSIEGENKHD